MRSTVKLIYALTFLLIVNISLKAQPLPGKLILEGSSALTGQFFSTRYSSGHKTINNQINFQPRIGVFVSHFINLGISFPL